MLSVHKIVQINRRMPVFSFFRLLLIAVFFFLLPLWGNAQDSTETPSDEPSSESYDSALLRAANFSGTSNSDWQPYIHPFDGVEMVLVPAGCFVMGSTDEQIQYAIDELGESDWFENEQPANEVCFDEPFWIDRTEVTQGDFERLGGEQANGSNFPGDDLPVEQITWFEARDYCERQDKRLPTEAEWEFAARGVESLVFPWGNEFDGNLGNYCDEDCENNWRDNAIDDGYRNTAPVGTYPTGASWVGALDMSGNVWEWVNTIYAIHNKTNNEDYDFADIFSYPYLDDDGRELNSDDETNVRVSRGGSWYDSSNRMRSSSRLRDYPSLWLNDFGFRCVLS